jgi:spore maturation protein CgeB
VAEWEYVPIRWGRTFMRVVGAAVRSIAVREFNEAIVRQASQLRPELFVAFKGSFVLPETLDALRERDVRTYCFFPDVSFRAHGPYLPRALPKYDWVFTTKTFGVTDMREQLGITRASVLLHGFDPDVHRPHALTPEDCSRYACDASFIGTWSPKKEAVLDDLVERLPGMHLRVWGEQWHKAGSPRLAPAIMGYGIEGEEYARAIIASKVNICILSEKRPGASSGDQITSRTFHIPACGGFMLHERTAEATALLHEDRECAYFADSAELAHKVTEFLSDETRRMTIADRGRELVGARHSWDHRIRTILAKHEELNNQAFGIRRIS